MTAELLRFCDEVVLNVRADNPPALAAYRALGYREHIHFEERLVHRRGSLWDSIVAPDPAVPRPTQERCMTDTPAPEPIRCRPPPVTPPLARPLPSRRTTSPIWVSRTKASAASNGPSGRCPSCASSASASRAEQPLAGLRIAACLHVTTETANLMRTLKAGGAEVTLTASNPLSTKDDVAAALVARYGISTYAIRGEDHDTYYRAPQRWPRTRTRTSPWTTAATSCRCSTRSGRDQLPEVLAGTEETTTGVIRLQAMAADGALAFPVVAVNEAQTKHLFDNRYGTGQSTVDGILRATNILLAGRRCVVAGYGWVGRGIASRLAGMGALVTVVEVDPVRAIEALMDGYQVMTAGDAAALGRGLRHRHGQHQRLPRGALRGHAGRRASWPTAATSMPSWSSRR